MSKGMKIIKPNVRSYNAVINAWAKSGRKDAGIRAEKLLERLYELGQSTGEEEMQPNTVTFTTTIDAWAKSSNRIAPERAEMILNRQLDLYDSGMERVKPDILSLYHNEFLGKISPERGRRKSQGVLKRLEEFAKRTVTRSLCPTQFHTILFWMPGPSRAIAGLLSGPRLF
jgi:hypothetical protein